LPASDVEIILLKQLASCLAMPMFVFGPDGELLFFNESGEALIGRRYDEWQATERQAWGALLRANDASGNPLPDSERPAMIALDKREFAHRRFFLGYGNGLQREVEGTAFPLVGKSGSLLGALGMFWEFGKPRIGDEPSQLLRSRAHQEVEVILMRRLAGHLATPIFIQHADGELLYFNPAAEPILGIPYDQVRVTPRHELYATFSPTDESGTPIESDEHPLNIARYRREPAHRRFWLTGVDGVQRKVEFTAIPLIGQSGRMLGASGFFWEIGKS
jgi:PAS domain-containing protein